MKRRVVLVNGPPAAGKTTVAVPLSRELDLPLLQKDEIKEALFEALGAGDADWSQLVSRASFLVMFAMAAQPHRVVLDGNFHPADRGRIIALDPEPIEIYCYCSDEELQRRFEARAASRHPGHHQLTADELLQRARLGPLALGGPLLELDTEAASALPRAKTWLEEHIRSSSV